MNPQEARDRNTLIAALSENSDAAYLLFWGHRPAKDGSVTKSCFSQWYPSEFQIGGKRYATAEHFMMAAKARLFGDTKIESEILACEDPAHAKKLGRRVQGFDEKVWKRQCFDLVVEGNLAKFSQNRDLGDFLKLSADQILVEASPVDRIWGIGLAQDHPDALNPAKWPGQNLLGFALMEVRATLLNPSN